MNKNTRMVHSRMIATRLRQFRVETGRSGDIVADRLGWSPSKVSRIELARTGVSLADLRDLLDLYKVSGPERDAIDQLAERIAGRELDDYSEAAVTMEWSVTALPASVRTAAYARSVLRAAQPVTRILPRDIENYVQAGVLRQASLTGQSGECPAQLRICLDEAVLRRQYGSQAVMTAQLGLLLELGSRPNIAIRVLPLATPAIRPPSFSLFCFTGSTAGELVMPALSVEHAEGTWTPGTDDGTYLYQVTFDHLWSLALPEARTTAMIRKLC